jgi:hypothetical protein
LRSTDLRNLGKRPPMAVSDDPIMKPSSMNLHHHDLWTMTRSIAKSNPGRASDHLHGVATTGVVAVLRSSKHIPEVVPSEYPTAPEGQPSAANLESCGPC